MDCHDSYPQDAHTLAVERASAQQGEYIHIYMKHWFCHYRDLHCVPHISMTHSP